MLYVHIQQFSHSYVEEYQIHLLMVPHKEMPSAPEDTLDIFDSAPATRSSDLTQYLSFKGIIDKDLIISIEADEHLLSCGVSLT